ncbi:MAG TPA: adenylate/guanylate cyclase domain-containing protein [Methylomirabilota bacterium]|nr:adenylate/guanylate cyclase domain-containing protein [Methylomirabilota bacterium]
MADETPESAPASRLHPWQRLSVRLALLLTAVTLLAVGAVGGITYKRYQRELSDTVGTQLLNIARVTALAVDPSLHAQVQRAPDPRSQAYLRIKRELVTIQNEVLLTTPIFTLTNLDASARTARVLVVSDGPGQPGDIYQVPPRMVDPLRWTFEDGVARYTDIYTDAKGTWITAFAPILDRMGATAAVVVVNYPVEIYLDRLQELRRTILWASGLGALGALVVGFLFARRLTRPIRALTVGVGRVAAGDLSQSLPVRSRDEVGQLTRAFNGMLEGLRQRDFIRSAFGRYVSPEVAKTLLESPGGLRFGGEKRVVTVLMSDLRGYTRFAEHGDPAVVMDVLNGFLGRMTDIIIEHGGTINEFIGDAIFAVFGAPLEHPDHAERAAGCALAMQGAMAQINREHAAQGRPRFEMGIGVNTGEAVVGNIGSEQRAKYAIVGSAVNVAARVEGATVGGQVFLTAETYARIRDLAEVLGPTQLEAKGLSEPLALYELRTLRGRFAQAVQAEETGAEVAVSLPLTCRVIDGKVVRAESIEGEVVRLARHELVARLGASLDPLTNLRLRLRYPAHGAESEDIYGKIVRAEGTGAPRLVRIHLTSITDADAERLGELMT